MKITLSEKNYVPRFLIFCTVFALVFVSLLPIGRKTDTPSELPTAEESPQDGRPTVVIDAGHGGEDGGAVGINGVLEKDLNLYIAEQLFLLLRANGIPAQMTRREDVLLYDRTSDYQGQKKVQDLAARRKIAESCASPVFISIHMNSFPDSRIDGFQVYYSQNHPASEVLAQLIQETDRTLLLPDNQRKIKAGNQTVYLLERLECPAVLVECGFLSNPQECARLSDKSYQKKLAMTLYLSVVRYLETDF